MYQIKQKKNKPVFSPHKENVLKTGFNMEDTNLELLFEPQNQFF